MKKTASTKIFTGLAIGFFLLHTFSSFAQGNEKPTKEDRKSIMKDTVDGKLDFSRFLIDANGFVPIPVIITEKALGGFGGLLAMTFITPKKHMENQKGYVPPDITAFVGGYTVNNTWMVGAFRMGSIPKAGIKYRAFLGYANVNMDFYHTFEDLGEKKFPFNFKVVPIFASASKKVFKGKEFYLGMSYAYVPTKVAGNFSGTLPPFVKPLDLDNKTATLGLFTDLDTRNSIFTPDKGLRTVIEYKMDANWTGSDYNYQRLNASINWFIPIKYNWICGIKGEFQQAFNDPPFYFLPYINMRGIPAQRYSGTSIAIIETEQRFDINDRWSILGFGGLGNATQKGESFGDGQTVYSVGTGFRYLLARIFKLRAGIDIAKGTGNWGYYIVFGHNWNR